MRNFSTSAIQEVQKYKAGMDRFLGDMFFTTLKINTCLALKWLYYWKHFKDVHLFSAHKTLLAATNIIFIFQMRKLRQREVYRTASVSDGSRIGTRALWLWSSCFTVTLPLKQLTCFPSQPSRSEDVDWHTTLFHTAHSQSKISENLQRDLDFSAFWHGDSRHR